MNINTTPPNNLDQLVAWTRVFVSEVSSKFLEMDRKIKNLTEHIQRIDDEQSK
jgi:hypothetical protein